jgi:hypothetical protein
MAITPLPSPPSRSDPTTFSSKADTFLSALPTFAVEANTLAAALNAIAAGGAFAMQYTFDSATTNIDPGIGKFRLSGSVQNTSAAIFIDTTSADNADYSAALDRFDASTSAAKGYLMLKKADDASKWLLFYVTGRAGTSGYRAFYITFVAGSSASPFANNNSVIIQYTPNGDKGDIGATPTFPYIYVRDEKTSGTGAGTASNGSTARTLNTVKVNTITGASLSSNAVTLPAGTYEYVGSVPGYMVNNHQAQLWNSTDGTQIDAGTSEYASSAYNAQNRSIVRGAFTIASSKTITLRHLITNGGAGTFGQAASNGVVEVYAELWIKKVA